MPAPQPRPTPAPLCIPRVGPEGWGRCGKSEAGWPQRKGPPSLARVPPCDWHLLGDLCLQAGAVKLLTSRWMGSSDLETSRRKVGSKGPDSKAARAPSGTFTDTRA